MADYNFNVKINTKNFEIGVDNKQKYGYFEHNTLGDGCGGGLWFEVAEPIMHGNTIVSYKLELIDYDGTTYLPKQVANALRENDYIVSEDFD